MPISLLPGRVQTPEFSTNMSALYRIEIAARTDKGIPPQTLDCLLGGEINPAASCAQQFVIRANWDITSQGRAVARGSSYDKYCCGNFFSKGLNARQIGSFHSKNGQRYVLDLQILKDGSALSGSDPHLVVEEGGDVSETGSVVEGFLLWPCGVALIFGTYLLISAAIRSRRSNPT
jgi:hypothetical protein